MVFNLTNIDWSAISAVTSVLAFLLVYLTLKEMKKQRVYSYRPVLVISKPHIVIQNDTKGRPTIWKNSFDEEVSDNEIWVKLAINNIGLGAARDIKVIWNIKASEMIAMIDGLKYGSHISKIVNGTSNSYIYNDFGFIIDQFDSDLENEIPYMVNGQSAVIQMPNSIKAFLSLYSAEACRKMEEFRYIEEGEVPLLIDVKCIDSSGKRVLQKYRMRYDIYVDARYLDKPNSNLVFGKISFL